MTLLTKNLQRRGFLGGATALITAADSMAAPLRPMPAMPKTGRLHFKILRNGLAIGEQFVSFTQNGATMRVETSSDMLVRILGLPVFRYSAQVSEYWLNGQFDHLQSKVNHNGEQLNVAAHAIPGGYAIESTKAGDYTYTGVQKMLPLTYWNKQILNAMLLNIETGRHYPATAASAGWEHVPTAEGGQVLAQRFNLTNHLHLTLWYDQADIWSGLAFNIAGHEMFQRYMA